MLHSSPFSRRGFLAGSASLIALTALPDFARAQGTPRAGGTLVVAADTEPRNLNPAMVASNDVFFVASKVIEPLAEATFEGPPRPLLATSWEGSADGKSITFKLRQGVKFHDGQPFTSADVAFSAMEVWKPLQNFGRIVFKNLDGGRHARTTARRSSASPQPTPPQLIENALPALTSVLPKHLYAGTDIAKNPHNADLVGTGPFRFVEYKPGSVLPPDEEPGTIGAAGIPISTGSSSRSCRNAAAISNALETGDIQLAAFSAFPLSDLDRLAATGKPRAVNKGYEGITYQITLEINHRRKEFPDVRVRQAIWPTPSTNPSSSRPSSSGMPPHRLGLIRRARQAFFVRRIARPTISIRGRRRPFWMKPVTSAAATACASASTPARALVRRRASRRLPAPGPAAVGIDAEDGQQRRRRPHQGGYTDHSFDLAIGSPVYRNDPAISTTILYQGGLPDGVPFSNQYGFNDPAVNAIITKASETLDGSGAGAAVPRLPAPGGAQASR